MRTPIYKILWLIGITLTTLSCYKEEDLTPSDEKLFPTRSYTVMDDSIIKMFGPYNCIVTYRYVENLLPNDWYRITPVADKYVLPMATFLREMWIKPLENGSSYEFVARTFPKQLVFVGSPALQRDGKTEVLGQAEGGTLIRFTRVNNFDLSDKNWKQIQLNTAFHEYAHILHQTFQMPAEFREVTPNSYTLNGWMTLNSTDALLRGMVTPYATSSVQEDFAELFAFYITQDESTISVWFDYKDPEIWKDMADAALIEELNRGSAILRKKLTIMKNMLKSSGMDIDSIRKDFQERIKS